MEATSPHTRERQPVTTLDFHLQVGPMTSAGPHTAQFEALPRDVAALCRIVQGLVVHEYMASAYGFNVPDARKAESHLRPIERIVDQIFKLSTEPLDVARPVERRLVGVCHHFALLFVALMRAHGIPTRYRAGLGTYFNPPFVEDHVVGEYWNADASRWIRVDAQLDDVWRRELVIDFDPLDVPHDRFITGGDAWILCRTGKADPSKFGIFHDNMRGLWFIAGEIVRDVAALNNMEMLPWDVWGAIPKPNAELSRDQLAFFDRLAELTQTPDRSFGDLRALYDGDERLRVPPKVFNAMLNRQELV